MSSSLYLPPTHTLYIDDVHDVLTVLKCGLDKLQNFCSSIWQKKQGWNSLCHVWCNHIWSNSCLLSMSTRGCQKISAIGCACIEPDCTDWTVSLWDSMLYSMSCCIFNHNLSHRHQTKVLMWLTAENSFISHDFCVALSQEWLIRTSTLLLDILISMSLCASIRWYFWRHVKWKVTIWRPNFSKQMIEKAVVCTEF